VLDQLIEVGRVYVESHDVCERHVGGSQDVLQVVEGHLDLRGHVARMLGVAVCVHRVLSTAHEQPPVILDELSWSNPNLVDQATGLIEVRCMLFLLRQVLLARTFSKTGSGRAI
jgi:hypothetical protein